MEIDPSNCRLCLTSSDGQINVFREKSSNQSIASILTQHFWFEINENDSCKTICSICWTKVEDFHTFYNYVYNIHYECLSKVRVELDDNEGGKSEQDHEDNECKGSEQSFGDNDNDDSEDLSLEDQTKPKVNKKPTPKSKQKNQVFKELKNTSDVTNLLNQTNENKKPTTKSNRVQARKNTEYQDIVELENRQIREYFKMECEVCLKEFEKFHHVQVHYRKEHNQQGYLTCCNKKYTKRSLLAEHIQRHVNPDAFKCDLCNKFFNNKRGLREHIGQHRSPDERPYKCKECPKSFSKKFSWVRHAYVHKNEEKKFICEDCDKPFGTKLLLQTHRKNIHEDAYIHICDICAKVFRSKHVFEHHHQTVHEKIVMPKVQCQICGAWLKDKYILNQHMKRHDESKIACDICNKEYLNRNSLRKHIRSVHSDKVYECSMCEKTFKKSISLKEHMATHTGDALYTCPYCPKTFNSSGNMYSHKKKYHPKEWKEHEKLKATGAI